MTISGGKGCEGLFMYSPKNQHLVVAMDFVVLKVNRENIRKKNGRSIPTEQLDD